MNFGLTGAASSCFDKRIICSGKTGIKKLARGQARHVVQKLGNLNRLFLRGGLIGNDEQPVRSDPPALAICAVLLPRVAPS